jgi:putative tricarboxylic transport membrane protein
MSRLLAAGQIGGDVGEGLALILNPWVVLAIFAGTLVGVILGAIPGIMGPMAMAAALPIAVYFDPIVAILCLSGIYTGSVAGSSISSILLNMPGQPGSEATAIDGFILNQKGQAATALGMQLFSSVLGTLAGYVLMLAMLPLATSLTRQLGPADRVSIAFMALVMVAALRGSSFIRGMSAGLFGLMLGTMQPTATGDSRAAFLNVDILWDGLPVVPVILGLLAFSELVGFLHQSHVTSDRQVKAPSIRAILATFGQWVRHLWAAIAGAIMGYMVGLLPAAGATVGSMFAYGQAKSWSRNKKEYGEGSTEGVAVAEAANNGSEGGAMLTMLSLGIPGSGSSAILMSAFLMFGLVPGPIWLSQSMDFAYAVVFGNFVGAFLLLLILAPCMRFLTGALRASIAVMAPTLAVVSTAGVFSLRSSLVDVVVLWVFAYAGWLMKKFGFAPMAAVLGFILGPIIDPEMYRITRLYDGEYLSLIERPVVAVSVLISLGVVANEVRVWRTGKSTRLTRDALQFGKESEESGHR